MYSLNRINIGKGWVIYSQMYCQHKHAEEQYAVVWQMSYIGDAEMPGMTELHVHSSIIPAITGICACSSILEDNQWVVLYTELNLRFTTATVIS